MCRAHAERSAPATRSAITSSKRGTAHLVHNVARPSMPHPPRLELELQLGAEVLGPLEEELAEEHRGPLILDQQPDTVRATRRCPFDAPCHELGTASSSEAR